MNIPKTERGKGLAFYICSYLLIIIIVIVVIVVFVIVIVLVYLYYLLMETYLSSPTVLFLIGLLGPKLTVF